MGDFRLIIITAFVGLGIMVAFGATFITMASDEEFGYNIELSEAFETAFTNSTSATDLIGNTTEIGYDMNDELQGAEAKAFDDFYDAVQQAKALVFAPLHLWNFIKDFFGAVIAIGKFPPILIWIGFGIIIFLFAFIGIKLATGRDL